MIKLDGQNYKVHREGYRPKRVRLGQTRITLGGKTDRTECAAKPREWNYTLKLTASELATLVASYEKRTPLTNRLEFIDEDGVSTHLVYFEDMGEEVPITPHVTGANAYFTVDVRLTKVLS
jgi:hypothetical protein